MEEEYIEVPYGREAPEEPPQTAGFSDPPDTASDYPTSPTSPRGGLNGLKSRMDYEDEDDDRPQGRNNFFGNSAGGGGGARNGASGASGQQELDKLKRDHEATVVSMQSEISMLKRELEDAESREQMAAAGGATAKQLSDQLAASRRVRLLG